MIGAVFTAERFQGNQLAIVAVHGDNLSQERKQGIAREFGFSETVFLHDAPAPGQPRRLDIFTTTSEIPFAGHPIIGTAHYIFQYLEHVSYKGPQDRERRQSCVLMTKGGPVPVFYNPYRQLAACTVPQSFHIHSAKVPLEAVIAVQPQVRLIPTIEKIKNREFAVASIIKGMTFSLIDLTDAPEVMAALTSNAEAPEVKLDEAWSPSFSGCMYYENRGVEYKTGEASITNLHCRMIERYSEDPGTGSASCALACYLALHESTGIGRAMAAGDASGLDEALVAKTKDLSLKDGVQHHVYAIEQGVEMGRRCQIAVEVDTKEVDGKREIVNVILSGRATFMCRGEFLGH